MPNKWPARGDILKVEELMLESRNSMNSILSLTEIPDLSPPVGTSLAAMDAMRRLPMKGERQMIWCIQSGDDVSTREALPQFVSSYIATKVAAWSFTNQLWEERIHNRAIVGKGLTPSAEKKYQEWQAQYKEQKLLFAKSDGGRHVTKINGKMSAAQVAAEYFSLEICMSSEADQLSIKTGNGEVRRLMLLKGAPVEVEALPAVLDSGLSVAVRNALENGTFDLDQEQEANSGSEGGDDGPADDPDVIAQQENEAMEIAEHDPEDCEEIMAFSDEEDVLAGMAEGKFNRVKTFMHREAFKRLEERGVTILPASCGAFLGYHATTRTWQGYYQNKSIGLSFTHGGKTNRSESEALFRVIRGILQKYCEEFPRDKLWRGQLNKLLDLEATVTEL